MTRLPASTTADRPCRTSARSSTGRPLADPALDRHHRTGGENEPSCGSHRSSAFDGGSAPMITRSGLRWSRPAKVGAIVVAKRGGSLPGGYSEATWAMLQQTAATEELKAAVQRSCQGGRRGDLSYAISRRMRFMATSDLLALVLEKASAVFGKRVGAEDNFFLLGGDSVRAVELEAQLEYALGREIDIASLFEAQDFGEFSKAIAA